MTAQIDEPEKRTLKQLHSMIGVYLDDATSDFAIDKEDLAYFLKKALKEVEPSNKITPKVSLSDAELNSISKSLQSQSSIPSHLDTTDHGNPKETDADKWWHSQLDDPGRSNMMTKHMKSNLIDPKDPLDVNIPKMYNAEISGTKA